MNPLVVLLTDFGLADPFVGQMKGVLLTGAPNVRIVDLSHDVPPHDVLQGAFFLAASQAHFPEGSLFVAVVDPGVGTQRRVILLQKGARNYLVPDNGLATLLLKQPGPARAFAAPPIAFANASPTFHGRDVFAPLAARFINGEPPHLLGQPVDVDSLATLPVPTPRHEAGLIHASVLHVDRFGNCVLNLTPEAFAADLARAASLALAAPVPQPLRLAACYGQLDPGQCGLILGSQGFYELALPLASAAAHLGLAPGSAVCLGV